MIDSGRYIEYLAQDALKVNGERKNLVSDGSKLPYWNAQAVYDGKINEVFLC